LIASNNTASGQFVPGFLIALELLEPYLDTLVLAGGWVPFVYHHYLGRSATERAPLTRDIDIVVPEKIPIRGDSIDTVLKKAGLDCDFRSITEPPVTAYVGRIGKEDVEVEFLTHATGANEDVVHVQPGLTAQSLHYLSLLYDNTWIVELERISIEGPPLRIRVPTPAAFVVHKGIIYRKRREQLKKAKDLFYLFHVLAIYGDEWETWIRSDLAGLARKHPTWLRRMVYRLESDFQSVDRPDVQTVVGQRPAGFLADLNDEQLAQYVLAVVLEFARTVTGLLE
jgi:hypothetical protein